MMSKPAASNELPLETNKIALGRQSAGRFVTGVPFPRAVLTALHSISIVVDGSPVDFFATPLTCWDDGSFKWVQIGVVLPEAAVVDIVIDSAFAKAEPTQNHLATVNQTNNTAHLVIDSQRELQLVDNRLRLLWQGETLFEAKLQFEAEQGVEWPLQLDDYDHQQHSNPRTGTAVAHEITGHGRFLPPQGGHHCNVAFRVFVFVEDPVADLSITLHNPAAALHPAGLWDLGDVGSIRFEKFSVQLEAEATAVQYRTTEQADWCLGSGNISVTQHSSGGQHWNSPVHVDADNRVPFTQQGFDVLDDGQPVATGDRATPSCRINRNDQQLEITLPKFWQNFPSAMICGPDRVELGLFPKVGYLHELQGGEKKTHQLLLGINPQESLNYAGIRSWSLPSEWLESSGAIPFYACLTEDPLCSLLAQGLTGEQNFFAKREWVDEFGWRHFGDLYADHESAESTDDELFVSHYNNQYDPLYGFLRQFAQQGTPGWYELAADLAQHIVDIDIYHTTEDKHEYNGGLFWHTDHYVKACTSTHRSFSQLQAKNVYMDHAGGGGPGGQHCYTTGLMLHYGMTGNSASQQAVIALSDWVENFYEGRNTLFEWLLSLKNRHVPGLKDHFKGRYPLDRGTGNYIIALLDAYEVTGNADKLQQAFEIIRHTVAPDENLAIHRLDDVEHSWFYTVFLQAVYRFLWTKERLQQLDDEFYYARDCLLTFAEWMAVNEYPYLQKPEILEYPNDTWTAQDLRKACVLAAAFYYSNGRQTAYAEKAVYFRDYVADKLTESSESGYTRVQAILLQNHGITEFFLKAKADSPFAEYGLCSIKPGYRDGSFAKTVMQSLFERLRQLSLKEELCWLRARLRR